MKKNYIRIAILSYLLVFSLIAISVNAEETTLNNSTEVNTNNKRSPERGKSQQNNVEMRKEIYKEKREDIKEVRAEGKAQIKDMRAEMPIVRREIKNGSSTEMFRKMKDNKTAVVNKMRHDTFKIRKDALVKQLTISIENLTNISARISERIIQAEQSGRNMTEAKASLQIANGKLLNAKTAVSTLAAYTPPTTSSSTDSEVSVEKPRQIGDAAIKSVKEARDSFKKVIQDIAKAMGLGNRVGNSTSTTTSTTTPPVVGTTTPPVTGTTTATTTTN